VCEGSEADLCLLHAAYIIYPDTINAIEAQVGEYSILLYYVSMYSIFYLCAYITVLTEAILHTLWLKCLLCKKLPIPFTEETRSLQSVSVTLQRNDSETHFCVFYICIMIHDLWNTYGNSQASSEISRWDACRHCSTAFLMPSLQWRQCIAIPFSDTTVERMIHYFLPLISCITCITYRMALKCICLMQICSAVSVHSFILRG